MKSFVYKVSLVDFGKDLRYWVNLNSDEVMKVNYKNNCNFTSSVYVMGIVKFSTDQDAVNGVHVSAIRETADYILTVHELYITPEIVEWKDITAVNH